MDFLLNIKEFSFDLIKPVKASQGIIKEKKGWILNLKNSSGYYGWGEISPINSSELNICKKFLANLKRKLSIEEIESYIYKYSGSIAFGFGSALAEIDHLEDENNINWMDPPKSALLLHSGKTIFTSIDNYLKEFNSNLHPPTFKVKVAIDPLNKEIELIDKILDYLPERSLIRIDANGGWNIKEASYFIDHLTNKKKQIEWLEQPLPAEDISGLNYLSKKIPIALDESLMLDPSLKKSWEGWQVRHPIIDGDPRILLKELKIHRSYRVISTAFETGIGRRWVNHLAALQQQGPTPTAPGLAKECVPEKNPLFDKNPKIVWNAA